MRHKHPANIAQIDNATLGGRAADKVAGFMGSWRFIWIQTTIIILWIVINVVALFGLHWDPYPFILLNLVFSTQAAYAAPILQLASNRQSEHDRLRAETDYQTNELAFKEVQLNTELTRQVHDLATTIATQTNTLDEIHRHVQALTPQAGQFPAPGEAE